MLDEVDAEEDPYFDGSRAPHRAPVQDYVIQLPKRSNIVHEVSNFDTQDNEDHTFSGIMFDLQCGDKLPLVFTRIDSVWVRGMLGGMRVFIPKEMGRFEPIFRSQESWKCVYQRFHDPSLTEYTELKLDEPIVLLPGEVCGVYIHSSDNDSEAIVYDESSSDRVVNDTGMVTVLPGAYAHLYCEPFRQLGWRSWRQNREFVGQISFGIKWMLWNPEQHHRFPQEFRKIVNVLLLIWNRMDTLLSWLPQEMVFYILNMVKWDDFGRPTVRVHTPEQQQQQQQQQPRLVRDFFGGANPFGHGQFLQAFQFLQQLHMLPQQHAGDDDDDDDDADDDDDDADDDDDDNNDINEFEEDDEVIDDDEEETLTDE